MNFLDISTLPGILTWILLILLLLTIAETAAVKDAQRKEEVNKLKGELDELYKIISQQRNNITYLQDQVREHARKETASCLCYRVGLVCPRCKPRGTVADEHREVDGGAGDSAEKFPNRHQ